VRRARRITFVLVAAMTAVSFLAAAQRPGGAKPGNAKPAASAAAAKRAPAGKAVKPRPASDEDAGVMTARDERPPGGSLKDAGSDGVVVEQKTADGGTRVFRFGEVEVEGRLKSPQIVYFLRRVRAEFNAGDLGHRSFVREMSETRSEPGF
jgi:hypothetical protein